MKRSCWLWKKKHPKNDVEYWIGDARDDNFVKDDARDCAD